MMEIRAVSLLVALASTSAWALDIWPKGKVELPAVPSELQSVREFVEKKKACELAIAELPSSKRSHPDSVPSRYVLGWKTELFCITDLKHDSGTINESSGCSFAKYDSTDDSYHPTTSCYGKPCYPTIQNKKCADGGFEELLKKPLLYHMNKPVTVADRLLNPFVAGDQMVIVVATEKKYADWFSQRQKSSAAAQVQKSSPGRGRAQ